MSDIDHPALYPTVDRDVSSSIADIYTRLAPAKKAFVDAYLVTMGESAKAAGQAISDYLKVNGLRALGGRRAQQMLDDPFVQAAIHQRAREICARFEVDQNALIRELGNIAFSNMAHYVHIDKDGLPYIDLSNVTHAQMSAISEITVEELEPSAVEKAEARAYERDPMPRRKIKLKLHSKLDAAEKLMKFLQMYAPERVEHHITMQAQVVTANMSQEQLAELYAARLKAVNG